MWVWFDLRHKIKNRFNLKLTSWKWKRIRSWLRPNQPMQPNAICYAKKVTAGLKRIDEREWWVNHCTKECSERLTSNPDFIFSIKDSIFASCCEFFCGTLTFSGTCCWPTGRKVAVLRPLITETWCRGDDGGLSCVSWDLRNSDISSSRAALFDASKSPNLNLAR